MIENHRKPIHNDGSSIKTWYFYGPCSARRGCQVQDLRLRLCHRQLLLCLLAQRNWSNPGRWGVHHGNHHEITWGDHEITMKSPWNRQKIEKYGENSYDFLDLCWLILWDFAWSWLQFALGHHCSCRQVLERNGRCSVAMFKNQRVAGIMMESLCNPRIG